MKNSVKMISFILCFFILILVSSCGENGSDTNNTTVAQKTYNTSFKQPTSAIPNTTQTSATEVTSEAVQDATLPTTVKRTGSKPYYEQTADMRKITSKQLLEQLGTGVTLGDSFSGYGLGKGKTIEEYETYLGNPIVTKKLIDAYYMAGFSAVRIPVSWSEHMDEKGNINDEWLDRIEEVVGYVLEYDMYCIINSQNDQNWLTTDSSSFKKTKSKFSAMWKSIAKRFKSYNDRLIFEGVDEILKADNDRSTPSETDIINSNKINQAFIDAVRSTGGKNKKRHLIVSTYGSFVDSISLNGFTVPKDDTKNRLIAKVNMYVPNGFCLDESTDNLWGSQEDKYYIESIFSMINTRFSELNIPVIVGEFGVVNKGNASARAAYAKHFVSTAYNYYIVCFWNDNGSKMKLFDRENAQNLQEKIVSSIIDSAR